MNEKAYLEKEIDDLIRNIKSLTKLIMEKYDPQQLYDQELMAVCSAQCQALHRLRSCIRADSQRDYQALVDDLLEQTWTAFAAIIGVTPSFIEDQYFGYVDSINTEQ